MVSFFCYIELAVYLFFFFSSRRRHTISDRDWSSDVCSSDLEWPPIAPRYGGHSCSLQREARLKREREGGLRAAPYRGERAERDRRPHHAGTMDVAHGELRGNALGK